MLWLAFSDCLSKDTKIYVVPVFSSVGTFSSLLVIDFWFSSTKTHPKRGTSRLVSKPNSFGMTVVVALMPSRIAQTWRGSWYLITRAYIVGHYETSWLFLISCFKDRMNSRMTSDWVLSITAQYSSKICLSCSEILTFKLYLPILVTNIALQ